MTTERTKPNSKPSNRPQWQTLSWWSARNQWRKRYKGRCYTLGPTGVARNRQTHDAALAEWLTVKANLDNKQDPFALADAFMREIKTAKVVTIGDAPKTASVGDAIDRFLAHKRTQAEGGQRSLSTHDRLRCQLDSFGRWFGKDRSVLAVNDDALEAYYHFLIGSDFADATKRDTLRAFKQYARFLAHKKLVPPLARLDDRDLSIRVRRQAIRTVPIEALQRRFNKATDLTKLYLLLMANCGFQQTDISDLTVAEIDYGNGRIIRNRSKTRHTGAPVIDYQLWDVTADLLREFGRRSGERALLNDEGQPLVKRTIGANGKLKATDAIAKAYYRLEQKMTDRYALKLIRKTSASILGENAEYSRFAQYFLGQRPTSIADLHYVKPSQSAFDAAVLWLGQQYGLVETDVAAAAA